MQNNNERGVLFSTNDQHSSGDNNYKDGMEIHNMEYPIHQMAIPENQKGQLETGGFGNGDFSDSQNFQQNFSKELNSNYDFIISHNIQQGHILGKYYFLRGTSQLKSIKLNLVNKSYSLIYIENNYALRFSTLKKLQIYYSSYLKVLLQKVKKAKIQNKILKEAVKKINHFILY